MYRLRTGTRWNRLPREFGSDTTVHDWSQRLAADGVFRRLLAVRIGACDELGGERWDGQAADTVLGKTRFGGVRRQEPHRSWEAGGEAGGGC